MSDETSFSLAKSSTSIQNKDMDIITDSQTRKQDRETETSPLLIKTSSTEATTQEANDENTEREAEEEEWTPTSLTQSFIWIQIALFSNVFLSGFDGTITASTYTVIGSTFHASNTISWLTTAYLITTTAFQPLYGRFSDILGRRACFFTATITFMLGCLGCGLAPNVVFLNVMRGVTGLGGGGLVTMATIVNSDLIPLRRRGMYQAVQNGLHGFGAVCGASLGGVIADSVGWRWCFLCQVPISLAGLTIGWFVIEDQTKVGTGGCMDEEGEGGVGGDGVEEEDVREKMSSWRRIDLTGAALLVLGLSAQLTALSLGGNQYPWSDVRVLLSFAVSVVILVIFVWVEVKTEALPVMPMWMLKGRTAISNMISNVLVGMSSYAFLFMTPLFFQVVLLDSASKAGMRLVIPSLATPIGGLIAGFVMSRWGMLSHLVRLGCFFMMLGNGLVASLKFHDESWKYLIYLFPANLGQGIVYPSILFTNIAAFAQADQAVSTSMVYLFRSMGTVWGVAAASTIIQNILSSRLPSALEGIPDKEIIIEQIRHSVSALRDLDDPEAQEIARRVYFEALRCTFLASTAWAAVALVAAFFARGRSLDRR